MNELDRADANRVTDDDTSAESPNPPVELVASNESPQDTSSTSIEGIEAKTRMYEAERALVEAKSSCEQQEDRSRRRAARRERLQGISLRAWATIGLIALAGLVAIFVVVGGYIIPSLQPKPENTYIATSDLEKAVNISKLSTVDYVHRGIAEKHGWFDWVDYRVKYKANVRVSFDMSQIRFAQGKDEKQFIAILPPPTVETPVIDESELDYLPESAQADFAEALELCREDAAAEVRANTQIEEFAYISLKNTVEALTKPLLSEEYSIEFERANPDEDAIPDSEAPSEPEPSDEPDNENGGEDE